MGKPLSQTTTPELHAVIGALHARHYLKLIGSSLRLLSIEMAAIKAPTEEQHSAFTDQAMWVADLVEREASDLAGALKPWDERHGPFPGSEVVA